MAFNMWTVQGNVSRDVELREAGKSQVAKFGIGISEKNREGTKTEWVDIEVWGAQGIACKEYVKKGDPILIAGKLRTNEWTDNSGKNRTSLVVTASQVTFLGHKERVSEPGFGRKENMSEETLMPKAEMWKRKEQIKDIDPTNGQGILSFKLDEKPFDSDLPF